MVRLLGHRPDLSLLSEDLDRLLLCHLEYLGQPLRQLTNLLVHARQLHNLIIQCLCISQQDAAVMCGTYLLLM